MAKGLIAALPTAYPGIAVQRCWAHKIRNVLNKVRKPDQDAVKAGLHAIMNAPNRPKALSAARHFADAWEQTSPKAVACLRNDLDDLLTCLRYKTLAERKQVRTKTLSNDASERSGDGHDPWEPSRTEPPWTASSSPSSHTKTSGNSYPFPPTQKS